MTHLFPAVLLLTIIAAIPGQRSSGALDWDKAAKEIRRLPPGAFPQLGTHLALQPDGSLRPE